MTPKRSWQEGRTIRHREPCTDDRTQPPALKRDEAEVHLHEVNIEVADMMSASSKTCNEQGRKRITSVHFFSSSNNDS